MDHAWWKCVHFLLACFMGCIVMDCGWLRLCCCAGPFPRCSLCCSHWGGLVVICLGLMLPALHSAPVGPREGRPPSATAETHTHVQKRTHPRGGFFSFSTRAKHRGRRPSHRFSLLCSALPHLSSVSIFSYFCSLHSVSITISDIYELLDEYTSFKINLFPSQQHWMDTSDYR